MILRWKTPDGNEYASDQIKTFWTEKCDLKIEMESGRIETYPSGMVTEIVRQEKTLGK